MQKLFCFVLTLMMILAGCGKPAETVKPTGGMAPSTAQATTVPVETVEAARVVESQPEETEISETEPPVTEPAVAESLHSALYLETASVEDVILWFNEVVLDSEFNHGGDPSRLQKWADPIYYGIEGQPTQEDLQMLESFCAWLNTVEGFPGIFAASEGDWVNLRICFTDEQGLLNTMGAEYTGLDGAVTFWYDGSDRIYDAVICIRTDLDQHLRNSVILEELYNGLGPVQDTGLRPDSIIYQEFAQPQALTAVDELLLKLLYHPEMLCGMDADQCEAVIRILYY